MSVVPCVPQPITPGIVVFNPAVFKAQFPDFATVADGALQLNFTRATLQLNNSCGSRVKDANQRELLLNLLVAHITALFNGVGGQPPQGVVGRISDATEGSVSVSSDYGSDIPKNMAYYIQTRWGAEYWQATARYRTMRYIPPPAAGCCNTPGFFEGMAPGIGPMGGGDCGFNGGSS